MLSTKSLQRKARWQKTLPALRQGGAVLAGFLLAGGPVLELYPLGLAYTLGVPERWMYLGAAGAAFGSLLTLEPVAALRTVGAVAAALAGRAICRRSRWAGFAAGCGCLLLVQGMLALSGLSTLAGTLAALGEAALALLFGLALSRAGQGRPQAGLVWIMLFIPALEGIGTGAFRPGFLLAGTAGLALAYRGEVKHAAVGAICWGGMLAAADPALLPSALGLCGGVLAGAVFGSGEKMLTAGLFAAAQLCSLGLVQPDLRWQTVLLCGQAVLVFCLIPRRYLLALPGESSFRQDARQAGLVGASGRLTAVADALADVAQTVDAVMDKLPKAGEGYEFTVDYLARGLCVSCRQRERCWIREYNDTVKGLYSLKGLLEEGQRISVEQLPPQFYRCEKPAALCSCLCQGYAVQCSRRESALRMTALRSALSEQYGAMAGALAHMAEDLAQGGAVDETKSSRVASLLESMGLEPLEALVQNDGLGRMKVTATLSRTPFEEEELQGLAEEVEHLCRRSFGLPQVNHCRTVTTLTFAEKPVYEAVFGLALRPARQEASGDAARQFCDGSGRAHMLLCDGMGVGKYAAVDGAMAANLADRLLRTGFEGDTTARLVNVALNLKSEEESGAALDLLSVDLYTGRVRLYKAGAAPSFTVQQGKVRAVEGAGLPVGILKEVSGKEHRFGMAGGDWIVLVSDGVLGEGDTWLRQQIELCAAVGNTPQEMADILADTARRRQSGTAPADDITVEVLKLERSL